MAAKNYGAISLGEDHEEAAYEDRGNGKAAEPELEPSREDPAGSSSSLGWMTLVLAAMPWIGVQALWTTEFVAAGTYFTQELGYSPEEAALTWIAGPVTGFITAPIVGSLSDRCESRFGRRRPFIFFALVWLWATSIAFAQSHKQSLFPAGSPMKLFGLVMFILLDVAVNLIQTPVRAIVSDLATQEQQTAGQIIGVFFAGVGSLVGFGINYVIDHHLKDKFPEDQALMVVIVAVLSCLTVFIGIQLSVCKETQWVKPADAPPSNMCTPFTGAFGAVFRMSRDMVKMAFTQFFSWLAFFCFLPFFTQWICKLVFGGDGDQDKKHTEEGRKYEDGKKFAAQAGIYQACVMIVFSLLLVSLMRLKVPVRVMFSACLFAGAATLVCGRFLVGLDDTLPATLVVVGMAIPLSAANAFPFALVGSMNKAAQKAGKAVDTGAQMGMLNIFICLPQIFASLAVSAMTKMEGLQGGLAESWAFLVGGVSLAIAAVMALFLNDKDVSS